MGFKILNKFPSRLFINIFFNSPGPATINIWGVGRDSYWPNQYILSGGI